MFKIRTTILLTALFTFVLSSAHSQKQSVILYNSLPVKVELSEKGTIDAFIGAVPGYMDGYDISVQPIEVAPTKVEEPILPASTRNADYAVVSVEKEELRYKPNFATLDKSVISKLNAIAARLKADPNAKILLTAYTTDKTNTKLTKNRLDSAITYLGIKGILSYRIQTDIQQSEALLDVINVNYLN